MEDLNTKAHQIRKKVIRTICRAGGGHIPASLSIVEILTVLYGRILKIDPKDPTDPDRDRFILSKGHAAAALYVVLADMGFFDQRHLDKFAQRGSILGGHPDMHKVPGVEASTGALGHGLPFAAGLALGAKMDKKTSRVFVLMGDGECQEGTVWEAALFAAQNKLDNLTAIIDYNKLQALGRLDEIVSLHPMADKWKAFGWQVRQLAGHDMHALEETLGSVPFKKGKPSMIIAHTVKGKGVSFMENAPIWHYRMPNKQELAVIRRELELKDL